MTRFVAAVLDTGQLELFDEQGESIILKQGDGRIAPILELATPALSPGGVGYFDFDMSTPYHKEYEQFEEQTGGLVKFFRVAKRAVAHIFGLDTTTDTTTDRSLGVIPSKPKKSSAPTAENVSDKTENQKRTTTEAVAEIMAQATPVKSEKFKERETTNEETIIAVVGDKVVPGMENLRGQFANAYKLGSTVGVENFLKRISAVIDKRGHSINDLLRFMERGDLPIADDGSVVAYKSLKSTSENGVFVDIHSGKVRQKVGSFVCMDESMVDPNRYNECSNGLHIARRAYIRTFGGDVLVLTKFAPEDAIAVPHADANKIRVSGYHILSQVNKEDEARLRRNEPIQHESSKQALAAAMNGKHIVRIEEVRITEARGGGLKITSLVQGETVVTPVAKNAPQAEAIAEIMDKPEEAKAAPVDPKNISKAVTEAKTSTDTIQRQMFNAKRYTDLVALKKAKKKSWTMFGFTDAEVKIIEAGAGTPTKAEPKKAEKPGTMSKADIAKQEKVVSAIAPIVEAVSETDEPKPAKSVAKKGNTPKKTDTSKHSPEAKAVAEQRDVHMSQKDKVTDLVNRAMMGSGDRNAYVELLALKKASKKSWTALGVNNFEAIQKKFEG